MSTSQPLSKPPRSKDLQMFVLCGTCSAPLGLGLRNIHSPYSVMQENCFVEHLAEADKACLKSQPTDLLIHDTTSLCFLLLEGQLTQ